MNDLFTFVLTVMSSNALFGLLLWLLRGYIVERMKRSIELEYSTKLEAFKHTLRTEHDLSREQARTSLVREQAILAAATSSFASGHTAALERRLKAIEEVWRGVRVLDDKAPRIMIIADMLRKKDTQDLDWMAHPGRRELVDDLSLKRAIDLINEADFVEDSRPFLNENLWSLFFVYRALIGRTAAMYLEIKENNAPVPHWPSDKQIRLLLRSVLSEQERGQFEQLEAGGVTWSTNIIKKKMLREAEALISGQASAQIGMKQAEEMLRAGREITWNIESADAAIMRGQPE